MQYNHNGGINMCNGGGTVSIGGPLRISGGRYLSSGTGDYGINLNNSDIIGINAMYTQDLADSGTEGLQFSRGNGYFDSIWANLGTLYFSPNGNLNGSGSYSTNYEILHTGNISDKTKKYKWNSTIKGQTWSRLYTGNPSTLHHSSMFSITGSIGCVVFSQTFLVVGNHSTNAKVVQLLGGGYTQCQIRTLAHSSGTVFVDMYWAGNDCDNSSSTNTMTIEVNAICLSGTITPTTSFVSDKCSATAFPNASTIFCGYPNL